MTKLGRVSEVRAHYPTSYDDLGDEPRGRGAQELRPGGRKNNRVVH